MQLIKENNVDDKLLTGGGIIPEEDMKKLAKIGVGKLFGPGTSTQDAISYIRNWKKQSAG